MITNMKVKNHKALTEVYLNDIGHITVICGSNNSGKTTILEALTQNNKHAVGIKVSDTTWLSQLFLPESKRFSRPVPNLAQNWFGRYINSIIAKQIIWYSDEFIDIIDGFQKSAKEDDYLRGYSASYDYEKILTAYFKKSLDFWNPYLIPPKRHIEYGTGISLNEQIQSNGSGIINKLFYLKNQDLQSDDYQIYRDIYSSFEEITGSNFNVVPDTLNIIRLVFFTNKQWVPAADSGMGLTDVLVIVSLINILNNNVFLIEEPENHLHATYQKKLLNYLNNKKGKQFIITTHSAVFLDPQYVEKIFFCSNEDGISITDQTTKSQIISSLGFSVAENLTADLIILVEGPTDIPVIKEMLNWVGVTSKNNIRFWPLGGDIMSSLDLSVFKERSNVVAIVDSDPGSSVQRTRFKRNCKENGIPCYKLERYSIENYYTIKSIKNAFPGQISDKLLELEPNIKVDEQIGFTKKYKSIKNKNGDIVKHMSLSDIEGTDLHKYLLQIATIVDKLNQ